MNPALTYPTPKKAPFPPEDFYRLNAAELLRRSAINAEKSVAAPCLKPIRVGIFFDGTNNNMARDRDGQTFTAKGEILPPTYPTQVSLPEVKRSHSNIARLYEAYDESGENIGIFSFYIPGVGTPFQQIGELIESSEGKAFAKGGEARILYALIQVFNSIYAVVTDKVKFSPAKAGDLARNYERWPVDEKESVSSHKKKIVNFFSEYVSDLDRLLQGRPKPSVPCLTLDVFGFSRGGAQAVAFCHMLNDLLVAGKLSQIPTSVNFLGVFDVVASVGLSFSVALTTPVPEVAADGHLAWAKRILDPLPPCVRSGRHFIAAHEQRMNFPVTTQFGSSEFKQYYFPGVHSDVGGGYGPGEGGKAIRGQSELLSQISLAYMYKAARIEGARLKDYESLEPRIQKDFSVSSSLATAWESYSRALDVEGSDHGDRFRTHMSLYYRWRKFRLNDLERCDFYSAADRQSRQDIREANNALKIDLEILRKRIARGNIFVQLAADEPELEEYKGASQWQFWRQNQPATEWEKWVLSQFDRDDPLPPEVISFFDNYVHDSVAGFYLAGEVTEFDRRIKVESVMKQDPRSLRGFDLKIYEYIANVRAAQQKSRSKQPLTEEEKALVEEANNGTAYPLMADTDAGSMRKWIIKTQSSSRREGGGYLLPRFYFPRVGNFIHKEFKFQRELDRAAQNATMSEGLIAVSPQVATTDNSDERIVDASNTGA